jgi:mRNA interferase MazF
MNPIHGEVWLADLGLTAKLRPVIILSFEDQDAPRALLIYIPVTSQYRGSPYEIPLGHLSYLSKTSVANVQGIGSIPTMRFEKRLGRLPETDLLKIKQALIYACKLQIPSELSRN